MLIVRMSKVVSFSSQRLREDADILSAGENASDWRWSRRRFTRSSYSLSLEPYKWNQFDGVYK